MIDHPESDPATRTTTIEIVGRCSHCDHHATLREKHQKCQFCDEWEWIVEHVTVDEHQADHARILKLEGSQGTGSAPDPSSSVSARPALGETPDPPHVREDYREVWLSGWRAGVASSAWRDIATAPPDPTLRAETGPMKFGDDWTGIFMRGDHCFGYCLALRQILDGSADPIARMQVQGLLNTLANHDERGNVVPDLQRMRPFDEATSVKDGATPLSPDVRRGDGDTTPPGPVHPGKP